MILVQQQQNYNLIQKTKALINVDCIKICPFDNKLFAFAYYQQTESFLGGVSLQYYQHQNHLTQQNGLMKQFKILQCGPVLHVCWLNKKVGQKYILVCASRSEKLLFFSVLIQEKKQPQIQLEKQIEIQKDAFCLYVDACMRTQTNFQVVVSTNESQVFLLTLGLQFDLIDMKTFSKHQYAVWTCRLNPFSEKTEFVCGDQVNSIYWYNEEAKLVGKNINAHEQGICDLVFVSQHKMYSGGFDGFINQFDMRNFKNPLRTFKLGGTIWRVIPDQKSQYLLICNSSEKKFQIIDVLEGRQRWNSGTEHGSLAYSADWSNEILLTSSFYDKLVCIWKR